MKIVLLVIVLMSISMLMAEDADKLATVSIVGDTLIAKITVPADMHMAKQEDFVYVEVDSIAGVEFGKTIWPQGGHLDELGIMNYKGDVLLKRPFTISEAASKKGCTLKIYVGYQMCFATYCKPPEEIEFELKFEPQTEKGCGGCMHPCGDK
ncbi:MAG: hypothetical protein K9M99_11020 [Candidatus Cloacimonetes bacterium]|nr:hypothetical protein [Candidatus Cloacimonadota bacterium]